MCQKLSSGQAWNWLRLAWNSVICWLMNKMGIQYPNSVINTLVLKFILDCPETCIQYWAYICCIEDLLTILHILLNLPCTIPCDLFILNDLFQLLRYKLGRWGYILALRKFIAMFDMSRPSNLWNEYIYGCNTINSILSIRTSINTSIILLPTILLSLLSSTLFRTFLSQYIMVSSGAHLTLTRLAEITFVSLIPCSAITFPVALAISTKNTFRLCPIFNMEAFERQQLYKIWPYMGSIITCPFVNNPIYSSSNSFCSKVHLKINVVMNAFFGPPFFSMKSISSSQCLISVYEAWFWLGARR